MTSYRIDALTGKARYMGHPTLAAARAAVAHEERGRVLRHQRDIIVRLAALIGVRPPDLVDALRAVVAGGGA